MKDGTFTYFYIDATDLSNGTFNSKMYKIHIYNRTLSSLEIKSLYEE